MAQQDILTKNVVGREDELSNQGKPKAQSLQRLPGEHDRVTEACLFSRAGSVRLTCRQGVAQVALGPLVTPARICTASRCALHIRDPGLRAAERLVQVTQQVRPCAGI